MSAAKRVPAASHLWWSQRSSTDGRQRCKAPLDGRQRCKAPVSASAYGRRRSLGLVVVALALLAAAWLVAAPAGGPPLYDGLGFPDQPYRFLDPPAGYRHTPAPSAASVDGFIGAGTTLDASSAELGPQVEVFVNESSLTGPASTTAVHVRAAPVRAVRVPADGTVWGNAYHLSAASAAGAVTIRAGGPLDSIRLRAPTGPPPLAVIEFDDGSGWRRLATSRIGSEIYAAPLAGAGAYAVVAPPGQARVSGGPTPSGASSESAASEAPAEAGGAASRPGPVLVILGGGLLVLLAAAVLVRLRRARPGP